jgi:hypothetical protein
MKYEDIPLIKNVTYLRSYDLLVEFSNGERGIVDMSNSFEVPAALKYAPLHEFKKFGFDDSSIWWGNQDMISGHDSIYNMSIPIPQFISFFSFLLGVADRSYITFDDYINFYSYWFYNSEISELGIFWMNDSCSDIIHSKSVLEIDNGKYNPTKYSFQHQVEWEYRPKNINGSYKDYPRGRIFYQDNKYQVEIDFPLNGDIEDVINKHFTLHSDTVFKQGYW